MWNQRYSHNWCYPCEGSKKKKTQPLSRELHRALGGEEGGEGGEGKSDREGREGRECFFGERTAKVTTHTKTLSGATREDNETQMM